MGDWRCRCGAKNEDGWRYCEGCGVENPRAQKAAPAAATSRTPDGYRPAREVLAFLREPKPLSDEQGLAAAKIYRGVVTGSITAEEGQRRLEELFGPEGTLR